MPYRKVWNNTLFLLLKPAIYQFRANLRLRIVVASEFWKARSTCWLWGDLRGWHGGWVWYGNSTSRWRRDNRSESKRDFYKNNAIEFKVAGCENLGSQGFEDYTPILVKTYRDLLIRNGNHAS